MTPVTVVDDNRPRTPLAVVLLALASLVGVLTAGILYTFLVEYGPTTGSRTDGAVEGLVFAAVPLVVVAALAAIAFAIVRGSWVRVMAVAVVLISVGGALIAGAQAAVTKYDGLAKVPGCGTVDGAGARAAGEAFAGLEHPGPFAGGWSGVQGCGADLLNVTFAQAAAHYRDRLPAAGWQITRDDSTTMTARRADLVFVLGESCGPVAVEIRLADATGNPNQC
jgi:hypothetical protein